MSARRSATLPPPTVAPSTDDAPPTRRPRRAVAVALVVSAAVALGWLLTDEGAPTPGAGTDRPAPTIPAAPSDVTWRDFAGIALPISATDGPKCTDGGRAACFTRTDAGAALAAVHLLVRTFPFAGADVFGPTIRDQVVGPDADAFARLTAEAYAGVAAAAGLEDGAPVPSEGGWVAGYRLDPQRSNASAAADRTVRVLIRHEDADGGTGFTEYAVRLQWRDGDWALVAPAWGDWRSSARALGDADRSRYASYDTVGGA